MAREALLLAFTSEPEAWRTEAALRNHTVKQVSRSSVLAVLDGVSITAATDSLDGSPFAS